MQQMWHIFQVGGVVMYFLLACSIFAVTIGIQRLIFFKKACLSNKEEEELTLFLRGKNWEEARDFATQRPALMSQVVAHSLEVSLPAPEVAGKDDECPGQGRRFIIQNQNQKLRETTYQGEATTLIHRMHEGLRYLDTIVTLSPLLGLLGTVLGMIQSFQVMAMKDGQLSIITGGVAEALVATAFGLIVAVIALCVHTYLSFRLDRSVTTLEEWGNLVQESPDCRL